MPGAGVQRSQYAVFIQFLAGENLHPQIDALGVASDGRRDLPKPNRLVLAAGYDHLPVGTESRRTDGTFVLQRRPNRFTCGYVPKVDGPALTCSCHRFAIGAECHRRHWTVMLHGLDDILA